MFENPRRSRQARNVTTNVPKILDLKSSSLQIFSENWRWVPPAAVLSFFFFSSGILVISILMCGITVSSSPAVYGFSSFWLTVFGDRRSFKVLRYHLFALPCLIQVNTMCNTNQCMITQSMKLEGHAMTRLFDRSTDQGLLTFCRNVWGWFLMHMLEVNKHARWK